MRVLSLEQRAYLKAKEDYQRVYILCEKRILAEVVEPGDDYSEEDLDRYEAEVGAIYDEYGIDAYRDSLARAENALLIWGRQRAVSETRAPEEADLISNLYRNVRGMHRAKLIALTMKLSG